MLSWFKKFPRTWGLPMQDLIPPEIEEYAAAHSVAESDVCRLIREETYRTQDCPQMVVGPLEAAFLKVMVLAVRARRVLEIGTFTGYSALAMAEDRKSTRLNSSHTVISYAVFC